MCIYIHMYTHIYTCTYTHTYIYTHIHTYIIWHFGFIILATLDIVTTLAGMI